MPAALGQCPICQEYFTSPSEVSAIFCGHTFHQHCILQWFERQGKSATCPKCRKPANEKTLVRQLFFDQSGDTSADSSSGILDLADAELQNKVSDLQGELAAKESEMKNLKLKLAKNESECQESKSELKGLRKKVESQEGSLSTLRAQLNVLEAIKLEKQELGFKVMAYKKKLKSCEAYEKLFTGSLAEAKELLSKQEAESLPQMLEMLKNQYDKVRVDKTKLADANKKLDSAKRKLETDNSKQKKMIEALREEIKVLQGKNESPHNPMLRSFLKNSPSPFLSDPNGDAVHKNVTPATSKIVLAIPSRAKEDPENLPIIDLSDSPNVVLPGGVRTKKIGALSHRGKAVPSDGMGGRSRPPCLGMELNKRKKLPGLSSEGTAAKKMKEKSKSETVQNNIGSFFKPKLQKPVSHDDDVVAID